MYDVIVAGAGPAGSTAAKVLAENGLRVLLAERQKLPRYKSCSGVPIQKTMDLVRRCYGQDVPLSATCTPAENRGMIFTDDRGREFRFAQGGLNVWRSSFDHWLTEQAAASGAEVRDGTSAVSCEEQISEIYGLSNIPEPNVVAAADGVGGHRRTLTININWLVTERGGDRSGCLDCRTAQRKAGQDSDSHKDCFSFSAHGDSPFGFSCAVGKQHNTEEPPGSLFSNLEKNRRSDEAHYTAAQLLQFINWSGR